MGYLVNFLQIEYFFIVLSLEMSNVANVEFYIFLMLNILIHIYFCKLIYSIGIFGENHDLCSYRKLHKM